MERRGNALVETSTISSPGSLYPNPKNCPQKPSLTDRFEVARSIHRKVASNGRCTMTQKLCLQVDGLAQEPCEETHNDRSAVLRTTRRTSCSWIWSPIAGRSSEPAGPGVGVLVLCFWAKIACISRCSVGTSRGFRSRDLELRPHQQLAINS